MKGDATSDAARIVAIYLFLGGGWIVFSDLGLSRLLHEESTFSFLSLLKGLLFVLVTGLILFALIRRHLLNLAVAARELTRSEERLRLALSAAGQGLYDLDLITGQAVVNADYARMLGYDPETFVETNSAWLERLHPDDRPQVGATFRDYVAGKIPEYRVEFRQRCADGRWKWILSLGSVVEWDHGRPLRMLGTHTDIDARVRNEALHAESDKMLTVAGLAAGMAHEINNPLGIISQAAQNLERRLQAELPANRNAAQQAGIAPEGLQAYLQERRIDELLAAIREGAERAAHIVATMLQFSRRGQSSRAPYDLARLLDQALELAAVDYDLKKKYDIRNIHIVRDYAPDLPQVEVVALEIEQVLINLIKNAAQAMATFTPTAPPSIVLRLLRDEDWVRIEVEDNGPGMSEEVRQRIFEPFFTTKEAGFGTGLGLSVARALICHNHHGELTVATSPGHGARFVIRLPVGGGAP